MSIESVRKRLEGATPGPWKAWNLSDDRGNDSSGWIATTEDWVIRPLEGAALNNSDADAADAALIAHAPEDLRAALAVIAQADELADAIEEYFAPNPPADHFIADLLSYRKRREEFEALP